MALYEVHRHPQLDEPVLVLGMEGWIDAGMGAGAAMAHLLSVLETEVLATFDSDELLDFRSRRPVVRLADGVIDDVSWPEIQLRAGKDRSGRDVLLLVGAEPDMRWRAFVTSVVELGRSLGVRLVTSLGAFPAGVPHTRPVRLAATATAPELATQVGFVPGTFQVPAGIHAALQEGFGTTDTPAVGLWARVPHYAAPMPYPAASAALVDGLAALAGLDLDTGDLHAAATTTLSRIDELIEASEEHRQMVRQLEAAFDAEQGEPPIELSDLPSGDELAAELERFLRGEQ